MATLLSCGLWTDIDACNDDVQALINQNFTTICNKLNAIEIVGFVDTLPPAPGVGDTYILNSDGQIYTWNGTSYDVSAPTIWDRAGDTTNNQIYAYNGSSWVNLENTLGEFEKLILTNNAGTKRWRLCVDAAGSLLKEEEITFNAEDWALVEQDTSS